MTRRIITIKMNLIIISLLPVKLTASADITGRTGRSIMNKRI